MATVREPIPPHQRSTMTIGNMEEREARVTSPMAEYTKGDGEETGRGPRGGPPRTGRGLIPPAHGDIILTPNHSTSKPLDYHTQSSSSRDDLDYDSGYSNTPEIRTTSLSSDNGSHDERLTVNRRASPISSGVPSSLWSGHESTLDLVEEEDDCNEVDIERDSGNGNDGEVTSPGGGDIPHPMEGSNMFYHHPDDQTLIQVAHRRGISRSKSTDSQIISSGLIDSTSSVNDQVYEERGRWRRHSGGRQRTNSLFHKDTHVVRPANISDSKDTFQIQDDLSKENYHFTLSDALITVIEEYKSLLQEQAYFNGLRTASTSPSFDGNSIDHFQATSSTIQTPPTTTPITSRSNIPPPTRSNDRSLLHLMEQPLSLNTAESTAHGLLQYIARILDPSSIEFRTSKVVQLPSNFITTMRREKYLLYSFTNTSCPIRGGIDWAPPRKTIIHNIHSPVSWKDLPKALNVQGNRCIGCGMSLESNQIKFLRFCNYIGKYFCVSCHQNSLSSIPAYIILRWNFKRLPVSNFARDTLANIEQEPLFNVESLNPKLYAMVPELKKVKELREQLTIMRKYITTCRDPEGLTDQYNSELGQLTKGDVHIYSLDNFSQIRTGLLLRQLRTLAADSSKHIKSCSFCQGKGFVCELCQNESDIIFPFDQDKVIQCSECHICFHKKCYVGIKQCPKCVRRKERQQKRVQTVLMTNLEMD